ncbi:MAG: endolytic transglycosylase MltG [Muribaculaceae bacterium]|nr:endolytic transglycosylase MltG [Muribaculaceae bacterium]
MTEQKPTETPKSPAPRPKKPKTPGRKKGKNKESWLHRHSMGVMIAVIAFFAVIFGVFCFAFIPHTGAGDDGDWVYIPKGADRDAVKDSLKSSLGSSMGTRVYMMWSLIGGTPGGSNGAYRIDNGMTALKAARRLSTGRQTPVTLSFKGPRTMDLLAARIASQLECSPEEFLAACDEVLPAEGFNRAGYPAAFIPDTYEFYWNSSASGVVRRLLDYRNRFWTPERVAKAKREGLTKVQAATVASIIEEETAKSDERPKVARLYLNRLHKGMRLQADPTVKFATGDFSLRRIKGEHLKVNSPYNTYLHAGLPPGPIRVAAAASIDAVLNAPDHPYLFMCAKEDFSGYHNFATDFAAHRENARRYQAELNRRNIK